MELPLRIRKKRNSEIHAQQRTLQNTKDYAVRNETRALFQEFNLCSSQRDHIDRAISIYFERLTTAQTFSATHQNLEGLRVISESNAFPEFYLEGLMDKMEDLIKSGISSEILQNAFWVLANLTAHNTKEMEIIIKEYKFHTKGVMLLSSLRDPKIVENIIWFLSNCACVSAQFAKQIFEADLVKTLKILTTNKLNCFEEVASILCNLLHYISLQLNFTSYPQGKEVIKFLVEIFKTRPTDRTLQHACQALGNYVEKSAQLGNELITQLGETDIHCFFNFIFSYINNSLEEPILKFFSICTKLRFNIQSCIDSGVVTQFFKRSLLSPFHRIRTLGIEGFANLIQDHQTAEILLSSHEILAVFCRYLDHLSSLPLNAHQLSEIRGFLGGLRQIFQFRYNHDLVQIIFQVSLPQTLFSFQEFVPLTSDLHQMFLVLFESFQIGELSLRNRSLLFDYIELSKRYADEDNWSLDLAHSEGGELDNSINSNLIEI